MSNVNDQNEKYPKPTDDPGAGIETVTPDSQKESLPNDERISPGNTKDKPVTDSDVTEKTASNSQENNNESEHNGNETVTPHTENEDSPDNEESLPENTVDGKETDGKNEDTASENPEISQDKNGMGIETVTP